MFEGAAPVSFQHISDLMRPQLPKSLHGCHSWARSRPIEASPTVLALFLHKVNPPPSPSSTASSERVPLYAQIVRKTHPKTLVFEGTLVNSFAPFLSPID